MRMMMVLKAAGAVVLTYRFWSTSLKSDPSVLGKTVRLGSFGDSRPATVVGVLEPCVPYPEDTDIISNVVTSAHHLSATMVDRPYPSHDQPVFARLAPGVDTRASARGIAHSVYANDEAGTSRSLFSRKADFQNQCGSGCATSSRRKARTILLVLMAASILVFVIACSNVANLILARTVRREGELGIRAALGASTAALRRVLLAESLLLCVGGAGNRSADRAADGDRPCPVRIPLFGARLGSDHRLRACCGWERVLAVARRGAAGVRPAPPVNPGGEQGFNLASSSTRVTGQRESASARVRRDVQIAASFVLVASSRRRW
jgi:putative ABC transport system permease protein